MASKIYILIRDDIDLGHAIVAAAHAPLVYAKSLEELTVTPWSHELVENWLHWIDNSFRKVVCKVTAGEFEHAKSINNLPHVVLTESGLNNQEVAIVFGPREEWSKFFKYLKLYA